MRLFGRELHGIPKALVVLVTILLVASGLCGITTSIESHNHWGWFGPGMPNTLLGTTLSILDLIAYAAFMISGALTVLLLAAWPVLILINWLYIRSGSSPENRVQQLFGKDDDDDLSSSQ